MFDARIENGPGRPGALIDVSVAEVVAAATDSSAEPSLSEAFSRSLAASFPDRLWVRSYELETLVSQIDHDDVAALMALDDFLLSDPWMRVAVHAPRPKTDEASEPPLVLLASTPRAGNTLVQQATHDVLGMKTTSAHSLDDLDIDSVTGLVQMHLEPGAAFDALASARDTKVITMVRHPYDLLVSMLHFAQHDQQVVYWLDGAVFSRPDLLWGVEPTDPEFIEWATSDGTARLLDISRRWAAAGALVVRYEEAKEDLPGRIAEIARLVGGDSRPAIGQVPDRLLDEALADRPNVHRWRGVVDGFKDVLPGTVVERLDERYGDLVEELGYEVPTGGVGTGEARDAWRRFRRRAVYRPVKLRPSTVERIRERYSKLEAEATWSREAIDDLESRAALLDAELAAAQEELRAIKSLVPPPEPGSEGA